MKQEKNGIYKNGSFGNSIFQCGIFECKIFKNFGIYSYFVLTTTNLRKLCGIAGFWKPCSFFR